MKIKLTPLDTAFSLYVRLLASGYCKRCWLLGKPKAYKGYKNLDCAHFHSRSKRSVRWDIENVAPLCCGCHSFLDGNPLEKIEFFLEILGQEKFNALNDRANKIKKYTQSDIKELELYFKEQTKQLEEVG